MLQPPVRTSSFGSRWALDWEVFLQTINVNPIRMHRKPWIAESRHHTFVGKRNPQSVLFSTGGQVQTITFPCKLIKTCFNIFLSSFIIQLWPNIYIPVFKRILGFKKAFPIEQIPIYNHLWKCCFAFYLWYMSYLYWKPFYANAGKK